jgi:RNA polymerase sigma-70 factor, ECF subfamily
VSTDSPRPEANVDALVSRARRGDRSAFEALVRASYPDMFALALRLTGDEDDALDVVQDAFLRAYRSIRRFRGDAAFSTWMYRITANCSVTLLERRGRNRHQSLDAMAPPTAEAQADFRTEHNPEARSAQRAEHDRLVSALASLPEKLRAVVVLRDIYDLPHDAIASELGISVTAAKVRLHRARRQLRERLDAPGDGVGERDSGAPRVQAGVESELTRAV